MKETQHWWLLSEGTVFFALLLIGLGKKFFWVKQQRIAGSLRSTESHLVSPFCSHWKPQAVTKWHSWQQKTWLICFECDTQTACQIAFQVFFSPSIYFPNLFISKWFQTYLFHTIQNTCNKPSRNVETYHLARYALVSTGWVQKEQNSGLLDFNAQSLAVSWHLE